MVSLLKSLTAYLPAMPDPDNRLPFTLLAGLPFFFCYYVFAVLAILPNTFLVKLALLPVVVKLGWHTSVNYDVAKGLATSYSRLDYERIVTYNYGAVVISFFYTHTHG